MLKKFCNGFEKDPNTGVCKHNLVYKLGLSCAESANCRIGGMYAVGVKEVEVITEKEKEQLELEKNVNIIMEVIGSGEGFPLKRVVDVAAGVGNVKINDPVPEDKVLDVEEGKYPKKRGRKKKV